MTDDAGYAGDDEPSSGTAGEPSSGTAGEPAAEADRDGSPGEPEAAGGSSGGPEAAVGSSGGPEAAVGSSGGPEAAGAVSGSSLRSREVVVPLRVYKSVTAFTTLFSAVLVVAGFVLLDTATNRARAPLGEVEPVLAAFGLAAIAGGGLLYAFASRFRAEGMGKDKDDPDEPPGNG